MATPDDDQTGNAAPAESTALVVGQSLSKIEQLLVRLSGNDVHRTTEYNAVAGSLLRIEESRRKNDQAVDRIPELVGRIAAIERWLISLAEALDDDPDVLEGKPVLERLGEWATEFRAWVRSGGRADRMPGVVDKPRRA